MKINAKIIFILLVLLVIIIIISYSFLSNKKQELILYEVNRGEINEKILEIGTITQGEEINLSFNISEKIKQLLVKTGEKVEQGQVLATIDSEQVKNQLEEARANLQVVMSEQKKFLSGPINEEIILSQTRVENAKNFLESERIKLENIIKQTEQDINNAYQNTIPALETAYLYSYNSLTTISSVFNSYFSSNTIEALNFRENKFSIGKAVDQMGSCLKNIKNDLNDLLEQEIDNCLELFKQETDNIKKSLANIKIITESFLYKDNISTSEKTLIDTHRANINNSYNSILSTIQSIASIKLQNNIKTDNAKAAVTSAEDSLSIAQNNLDIITADPRTEDVKLYQGRVDSAHARARVLEKQLKETSLISPTDGKIIKVNVSVGEMAQPGVSVITILPEISLRAEINIYEEDIIKISQGNPADIYFVAYPKKPFKARVAEIEPAGKQKDGVMYYKVVVVFEESIPEFIKPGMTIDIEIITQTKDDIIIIPRNAIQIKDGKTILEVFKNEEIQEAEVGTGIASGDMIEIIFGINEGEIIVLR